MEYKNIEMSIKNTVAIIKMNRPDTANALSIEMITEISDALRKISYDDKIKVVILRSAGKHFSSGHNFKDLVNKGVKEYKFVYDECTKMMNLVHEIPQIVIAQVKGVATGGGCQLSLWCDLLVASEDARFSTPGVSIGLFCNTPMTAVVRAMGRKMAMEMLLTGRFFPAQEGKELGFVNKVVPLEELDAATEELAEQVAVASGFALSVGKQAFYDQIDMSDRQALQYGKNTMTMNTCGNDAQNAMSAFMNKNPVPEWQNS